MKARILIICILFLINCKDPIEIDADGAIGILVIDGKVSTLPGPYEVRIGYTVGINQRPRAVSSAAVTLVDDEGHTELYSEISPGVYSVPGNVIQGTAGHAYHVEVTLENGRSYSSKPEIIPGATGTDTPSLEFGTRSEYIKETEVKTNVINVYTDTALPAPGEKDYYFRWDVGESYMFEQSPRFDPFTGSIPKPCYITGWADPQRITLYSTKNQILDVKKHTLIAVKDINYSFLTKHWFNVYTNSITRESYEYWNNVNQLINRSGSIFDTPPAPIEGNVFSTTDPNEVVFGYFEAANTSLARTFILRGEIPVMMQDYCNDPKYGPWWDGYPAPCQNCLLLDGSSKTPPDWFQGTER